MLIKMINKNKILYDRVYKETLKYLVNINESNTEQLDEGIFTGLLGGAAGAVAGPAIMRAVCNVLGIRDGRLYDLLTSRLVTSAVGYELGK